MRTYMQLDAHTLERSGVGEIPYREIPGGFG